MSSVQSSFKWQHMLMMAGGAAAVGGVLYYLLRDDKTTGSGEESGKPKSKKLESEYTREDALEILKDISTSQQQMKAVMEDLTKELISKYLTFEETYERVKKRQPADPLELHNVTMQEFDKILERHQEDRAVREAIANIMGAPNTTAVLSKKAQEVTKATILAIHEFMLTELKRLVDDFEKSDKEKFEMKTVTIAAQAIIGAKVEEKFKLTSDEIEGAVLLHHQTLQNDSEFASLNTQMQQTMSQLLGQPFPAGYGAF